jgi:HAD superfamily hydrolase (TIGR01509 family)
MIPKAVIFDLNGTVLADERQYALAFLEVLAMLGKKVETKFPQTRGIGVKENWPGLIHKYKINTKKTNDELARMTQDAYLKRLDKVKLKKGLVNFIRELQDRDILIALATSNNYSVVEKIFDKLGIEDLFTVVTTAEDVSFNKPSPEIFTVTADKLGVEPEDCIVIEDAESGVAAAHAASMKVVAILPGKKLPKKLSEADLIIKSFNEISIGDLAVLMHESD